MSGEDWLKLNAEGDFVALPPRAHVLFLSAPSPLEAPAESPGWLFVVPLEVLVMILKLCPLRSLCALADSSKLLRATLHNEKIFALRLQVEYLNVYKAYKSITNPEWSYSNRSSRLAYKTLPLPSNRIIALPKEEGANRDSAIVLETFGKVIERPHVADSLCFLIRRMCFREVDAVNFNKKFFGKHGAIELLEAHLARHLQHYTKGDLSITPEERLSACRNSLAALNNIALDEESKRLVVECHQGNVIRDVLTAMFEYTMDEKVQEYACSTLWGVGIFADNKTRLLNLKDHVYGVFDAVDMLVRAMINMPDCYQVLRDVASGLWEFSLNTRVAREVVRRDCVKYLLEMMRRHYDKALLECDAGALAFLQDAIPAIRVITLQSAEDSSKDEFGDDLNEDEVVRDEEADEAVVEVFEEVLAIGTRIILSPLPPKVNKDYFETLDDAVVSVCAIGADEYGMDRDQVLSFGLDALAFVEKNAPEQEFGIGVGLGIFLCDLVKQDSVPFGTVFTSNIIVKLAEVLDRSSAMLNKADLKPDSQKAPREWRLIEFLGYFTERCAIKSALSIFWTDWTFHTLVGALARGCVACSRHKYYEGLNYGLPALYHLLFNHDSAERGMAAGLKADSAFVEMIRKQLARVQSGEIKANSRAAEYAENLRDLLRL